MAKKILLLLPLLLLASIANFAQEPCHFILSTPPKCGTHLLVKTLKLAYDKEPHNYFGTPNSRIHLQDLLKDAESQGKYLVLHAEPRPYILDELRKEGIKVITILRDPRDQLLSMHKWILLGHHPHTPLDKLATAEEQIEELMTGKLFGFRAVDMSIGCRKEWLSVQNPSVYTSRFEQLIGPQGGGEAEAQMEEILNITTFLEAPLTRNEIKNVADNLFGGTWTFRKGQIRAWEEKFTEEHKNLFKKLYGPLLIELGYEKDLNW